MQLRRLELGLVTMGLDPDDCIRLAAACDAARLTLEGSRIEDDHFEKCGDRGDMVSMFGTLCALFEAAGVAAVGQMNLRPSEEKECTLGAVLEHGATYWRGEPSDSTPAAAD